MTDIDLQKHLASMLTPDQCKLHRVTIIIGRAATLFKQMLRNTPYYTITKADEVRDFLNKFTNQMDTPLIFEDLSLMTPNVQTYLLKFIEEPPMPLVILASDDNISPIILSRCKRIIKVPSNIVPEFKSLAEFVDRRLQIKDEIRASRFTGEEVSTETVYEYEHPEEFSLKSCPEYLYLATRIRLKNPNVRNVDNYLKLM